MNGWRESFFIVYTYISSVVLMNIPLNPKEDILTWIFAVKMEGMCLLKIRLDVIKE